MKEPPSNDWPFYRFALIVTGKGEEQFLPDLFRSLASEGHCVFKVTARVKQLSPITSEKRRERILGTGSPLTSLDEDVGLEARRCLRLDGYQFVILVDDLEHDRREHKAEVYRRYRMGMERLLNPTELPKASVHFLVNMLEAYYFADASSINAILGTNLADHDEDVEEIRHPKNDLKRHHPGFDEVKHGEKIVARLDVPHILSNPMTCRSLRTLFAWCSKAIGRPFDHVCRLAQGQYDEVTCPQLDVLT